MKCNWIFSASNPHLYDLMWTKSHLVYHGFSYLELYFRTHKEAKEAHEFFTDLLTDSRVTTVDNQHIESEFF